jgi:hypothetical protein
MARHTLKRIRERKAKPAAAITTVGPGVMTLAKVLLF